MTLGWTRKRADSAARAAVAPGGAWARLWDRAGGPWSVLFWALLAVASFLMLRPLFTPSIPPITDFGGHLQMVDAWARLDADPFLRQFLERRDVLLAPNLLPARFVGLLYPLLSPLVTLRLFVFLCMAGLIVGMLYVLRVYGRSRWLVFLGLPLVWNGMLSLGLLSYALALVLMLFAIGLARRATVETKPSSLVWLGIVALGSFFAHGIGCPLTIAMAGFVIVASARRWRDLLPGLALGPAAVLWLAWWGSSRGELEVSRSVVTHWDAARSWSELLQNGIAVTLSKVDLAVFTLICGAWFAVVLTQRRADPPPFAGDAAPLATPGAGPFWRGAWARFRHDLYADTLFYLGGVLLLGYFFVAPAYIGDVFVSPRLIVPFMLALVLAPRLDARRPIAFVAVAVAIGGSFVYAGHIQRAMTTFQARELSALERLLDSLPERQRLRCVGTFRVQDIFIRAPLDHNCEGLAVARKHAFAGGGFAMTAFNAVALTSERVYVRLDSNQWQTWPDVSSLDYVIARGDETRPPRDVAVEVAEESPPWWVGGPTWRLYRVTRQAPRNTTYVATTPAQTGHELAWDCPPGQVLSGVVATTTPDGRILGSVQPHCVAIERDDDGRVIYDGPRVIGPRFGATTHHRRRTLECGNGEVLLGVGGLAGLFVDQMAIVCGEARDVAPAGFFSETARYETIETGMGPPLGGEGGDPYHLVCPEDSLPIGLRGGFGAYIDAIGVACADIGETLAWAPPPEPPPEPTAADDDDDDERDVGRPRPGRGVRPPRREGPPGPERAPAPKTPQQPTPPPAPSPVEPPVPPGAQLRAPGGVLRHDVPMLAPPRVIVPEPEIREEPSPAPPSSLPTLTPRPRAPRPSRAKDAGTP